jgi:hypothetical protein
MRSPITPAGILLLVLASSACASVKGAESRTGESPRELSSTPRPTGQNARGSALNPATPALGALVPRGPDGRFCLAEIEDDIWLRSREATTPVSRPALRPACPYSVELAITADDAWEVFIDGQKLIPMNGSAENDWRVPARYETVVHSSGSNLVIAIHAKDVEGVVSGVLASVRVQRVSPPSLFQPVVLQTGDGFGWYAFQPSLVSAIPPADWHTTPYLPFASGTQADWAPATPAAACLGSWSGSATFLNNWASVSGGAAPTGWVWELDCDAGAASWRQENWYRIDVPVDYCPIDSPPPDGACCTWTLTSHNAADGLFDTPPIQGCTTDTGSTPPQASCIDRIGCGWIPSLCKFRCGFDFWNWSCL